MKVILLKDTAGVGGAGEVKEVAPGYGRNFIIAHGWGLPATPANLERRKEEQAKTAARRRKEGAAPAESLRALEGQTIKLSARASETGQLFAGIHEKDIAEALRRQKNIDLPPESMVLEQPIKNLGEFTILVKLGELSGSLQLVVERAS